MIEKCVNVYEPAWGSDGTATAIATTAAFGVSSSTSLTSSHVAAIVATPAVRMPVGTAANAPAKPGM